MVTKNELVRMLNEGKTSEDLAKEFTSLLNEAIDETAKQKNKEKDLKELTEHFEKFFSTYYPNVKINFKEIMELLTYGIEIF